MGRFGSAAAVWCLLAGPLAVGGAPTAGQAPRRLKARKVHRTLAKEAGRLERLAEHAKAFEQHPVAYQSVGRAVPPQQSAQESQQQPLQQQRSAAEGTQGAETSASSSGGTTVEASYGVVPIYDFVVDVEVEDTHGTKQTVPVIMDTVRRRWPRPPPLWRQALACRLPSNSFHPFSACTCLIGLCLALRRARATWPSPRTSAPTAKKVCLSGVPRQDSRIPHMRRGAPGRRCHQDRSRAERADLLHGSDLRLGRLGRRARLLRCAHWPRCGCAPSSFCPAPPPPAPSFSTQAHTPHLLLVVVSGDVSGKAPYALTAIYSQARAALSLLLCVCLSSCVQSAPVVCVPRRRTTC